MTSPDAPCAGPDGHDGASAAGGVGSDRAGSDVSRSALDAAPRLTVLMTVPTLDVGAADEGAIDLARTLAAAGHRPVVASRGGRFEGEIARVGGVFVRLDAASHNPLVIIRNVDRLRRLVRQHGCDAVHAHGRASAWSAWAAARATGRPFVTTCYSGFREQNRLKHWYNGVMARADRVVAVSEQIGDLMVERHRVAPERLVVVHPGLDLAGFDPATLAPERIVAARQAWGVGPETRVVLFPGRILRRRGHHVARVHARPDVGGREGDGLGSVMLGHQRDALDGEAEALAGLAQQRHVAAGLLAEGEVLADHDLEDVQTLDEQFVHVPLGGQLHEVGGERHDEEDVDTQFLDQFGPAGQRRQLRGVTTRQDHFHRMRIERHQHGGDAAGPAGLHRVADQFCMSTMYAIEYPDGEHTSAPIRGDLVLPTPALHDRKPTARRRGRHREIPG